MLNTAPRTDHGLDVRDLGIEGLRTILKGLSPREKATALRDTNFPLPEVVVPGLHYRVQSTSNPATTYDVVRARTFDPFRCTCPATVTCTHEFMTLDEQCYPGAPGHLSIREMQRAFGVYRSEPVEMPVQSFRPMRGQLFRVANDR